MSRSGLRLVDCDGNILVYIEADEVADLVDDLNLIDEADMSTVTEELLDALEDELGS